MTRDQLEHVIRAAAANADTDQVVIIGSQSLLGSHPGISHPALTSSMEAGVFPLPDPSLAILIDGAIGERSIFHETFGYYAHGVGMETAVLPEGWRERLVPIKNENTRGNTGWCLDPHDLAVSKLVAGREKDLSFLRGMTELGLLDPAVVVLRLRQTSIAPPGQRDVMEARLLRIFKQP
ncbi:MAG: DUF6036 family nucleotidyltransferase [Terrimicrobiaceae bacterium]